MGVPGEAASRSWHLLVQPFTAVFMCKSWACPADASGLSATVGLPLSVQRGECFDVESACACSVICGILDGAVFAVVALDLSSGGASLPTR